MVMFPGIVGENEATIEKKKKKKNKKRKEKREDEAKDAGVDGGKLERENNII